MALVHLKNETVRCKEGKVIGVGKRFLDNLETICWKLGSEALESCQSPSLFRVDDGDTIEIQFPSGRSDEFEGLKVVARRGLEFSRAQQDTPSFDCG
jgi:hypothetical protein